MCIGVIICVHKSFAQPGLKTGINFANITRASSINNSSKSGFLIGGFFSAATKKLIGFRTELIYSRQGYDYKSATNTGKVNLDYILLPQLTVINITKYLQLQVGGQMAFLLNAKVDSSNHTGNSSTVFKLLDIYRNFDYGFTAGAEIHPYKGLLIGARYNISLNNLYKSPGIAGQAAFIPQVNVKNNVLCIFAGWTFIKNKPH